MIPSMFMMSIDAIFVTGHGSLSLLTEIENPIIYGYAQKSRFSN
jgi:hypothetical protein